MRKKFLIQGVVVALLCMLLFSGCSAKFEEKDDILADTREDVLVLLSSDEAETLSTYAPETENATVKLSAAPQEGANQDKNESTDEKKVNLLWLEIVLSVACIAVTVINAVYGYKHPKSANKSKQDNLSSVNPFIIPMFLIIFEPLDIIPAIIVLGVMTLASCGVLVGQIIVNAKRKNEQEDSIEDAQDTLSEASTEEIAEMAEEISESADEGYTDETDVFTEMPTEEEEAHKYISPENIVVLDEEQDAEEAEDEAKPMIALLASEDGASEDDADDDSDDESSEKNVFSDHGLRIYVSYDYSFEGKLRMSSSGVRHMHHVLSEYLKSFKLGCRRSWKGERYYLKGKTYARMMFRGKTLCVCLAIDPNSLEGTKYRCEDVSNVNKYAAVPCLLRLRSGRAFKNSLELIQMMLESAGIPQAYTPEDSFVASPPESRDLLIDLGLIKVLATDDHGGYLGSQEEIKSGKIDLSAGGMPLMHEITAEEAHKISDATAESFIHIETEQLTEGEDIGKRNKGIVNIDSISLAFEDGETVTLNELKNRGLVPKNVSYVKVLARGLLDKSLTVKAHDFSLDAIKMIIIAGGDAIEIKTV